MRRSLSINRISLVVIVGSLAFSALVPAVRDRMLSAVKGGEFDADLEQQAAKRPRDVQAWLALAAGSWRSEQAFQRVFDLKPQWVAPYLYFGADLVREVPLVRHRELVALDPGLATRLYPETPLTRDQRDALRRAREVLLKARSLDPDNAAPDYLLAYLALVTHSDDEAVALMRSALSKQYWSVGQREAGIALYTAALRSMPPFEAAIDADMRFRPGVGPKMRALALTAVGMAVLAKERGDHQQAILLRESMMHLGRLMMAHGYTIIDALCGDAVWLMAAGERLTPEEKEAAMKRLRPHEPGLIESETQRRALAAITASQAKMADYLRQHGRPDLAQSIAATERERRSWLRAVRPVINRGMLQFNTLSNLMLAFRQAVLATAGTLALLLLCALAYIGLRVTGRRPTPLTWARWKWGLVVMACLVLWFLAVNFVYRSQLSQSAADVGEGLADWYAAPWGGMFGWVALPLLVLSAALITWRVRRRAAGISRGPGFTSQFVATLMAVLLPLAAVLMLGCLAISGPLVIHARDYARHQRAVIYQGELAYYGLARPLTPAE